MAVHYAIRHLTGFRYVTPVSESVMELRMRPSNTAQQRCLQFIRYFMDQRAEVSRVRGTPGRR